MDRYPLESLLLPMNAKEVKDESKMEALWADDSGYVCEIKYDGSRYLSIGGRFFSRRISVKDGFPVEKTENVPHLAEILRRFPHLILDGEIYYDGMTSNEVTSIMGSLPERAKELQDERGYLRYVVFDILRDIDGNWLLNEPWLKRRAKLESTYKTILETFHNDDSLNHLFIKLSVVAHENKKEFYEDIVAKGGEGVMLKNINAKYIPDKRPAWNWVKVKKFITDDVVIMGFKPPVREYEGKELETWEYWEDIDGDLITRSQLIHNRDSGGWGADMEGVDIQQLLEHNATPVTKFYFYGWIGAVTFGKYDKDGNLVELGYCSGLTDELREDMSNNPDKYIGECMEIGAMEKTKDGFYRHPRFIRLRPDKNQQDCVID